MGPFHCGGNRSIFFEVMGEISWRIYGLQAENTSNEEEHQEKIGRFQKVLVSDRYS
jgi:hypothetical protein